MPTQLIATILEDGAMHLCTLQNIKSKVQGADILERRIKKEIHDIEKVFCACILRALLCKLRYHDKFYDNSQLNICWLMFLWKGRE